MAHPLSEQALAHDHAQRSFLELLYSDYRASDFPEHSLPPNFPAPGLNVTQDACLTYRGTVDALTSHFEFNGNAHRYHGAFPHPNNAPFNHMSHPFSRLSPLTHARLVEDQHIIRFPNNHSLPSLSVYNSTPSPNVQVPPPLHGERAIYSRIDSPHDFVDGNLAAVPSSCDPSPSGASYTREYRRGQPLGFGYRMDTSGFHHSLVTSAPAHEHKGSLGYSSGPLLHQDSHKTSVTQPVTVNPGFSILDPSHGTRSGRSSKGNRFNTRYREQADAAASSSSKDSSSCSPANSSQLPTSRGQGESNNLEVNAPSPYPKERTTFPGKKYKCRWESCKQTFVRNSIDGGDPSNAQERFQDAIERHIEDHIWISACGRKRKKWDCRWGECDEIMGSKRALTRHVGAHSGFRVLCDGCGTSYSRFDAFRRHQSRCGGKR